MLFILNYGSAIDVCHVSFIVVFFVVGGFLFPIMLLLC